MKGKQWNDSAKLASRKNSRLLFACWNEEEKIAGHSISIGLRNRKLVVGKETGGIAQLHSTLGPVVNIENKRTHEPFGDYENKNALYLSSPIFLRENNL